MQMYGFIFNVPNVPLSSLKILEGELPVQKGTVQKGTDPFCTVFMTSVHSGFLCRNLDYGKPLLRVFLIPYTVHIAGTG